MKKIILNRNMVNYLEWDSNFFGLNVGKVIISSQEEMDELLLMQQDLQEKYDLIYIFATEGINTDKKNATLVDKKVIYTAPLESVESFSDNHINEYQSDIVSDDLVNLSLTSGKYSRYNIDKNFPQNSYERLYKCWIEQSVKHVIATEVFCYMVDGVPRGLLTLNLKDEKGVIGLVATNRKSRGCGIGTALLEFAKSYCFKKGIKDLSVATQYQNRAACHLYEKTGFVKQSCTDIWHWWLSK